MIRVRLPLSRAANSCGFLDFHGTTDSSKRVLKEATSDNPKFMLRTDGKESIQFKTFAEKKKSSAYRTSLPFTSFPRKRRAG